MGAELARHDVVLRAEIDRAGGTIFKHTGDGCLAVFPRAEQAVSAAVAIQRGFAGGSLRLRVVVHSGWAEERGGDYFGPTLNRAARLLGAGHGGQILASDAAAALARGRLDPDVWFVDLGEHRLRDLAEPERVHQVTAVGLEHEFPPLRSEARSLGRLPTTRTSLIGRSAALDELEQLCAQHRLVTLTGVGGTGKTRLAIPLAERMQGGLRDGACFVDLAPVADPSAVVRAVAEGVGMPLVAGQPLDEDLARFLARVRAVVVLDNCEHVLDAAAELVDVLIERDPHVRILATSRQALGVDGEQTWRVPSLAVDADADGSIAPATSLFVDRAVAAGALVDRDDAALGTVGEIVRRLDGIPLAIELAAARAVHFTPTQILAMLDDRFVLLAGGRRRAPQRQATLAATVDWSHDLLNEPEQRLLRRLAVFSGTFAIDAVATVCTDADAPTAALGTLTGLVDKSLVVAVPTGTAMRYRMLETIRLYAQDKLVAAGEAAEWRDRHRDHYLAWSEAIMATDPSLIAAQELVEPDADNFRAAIDWSLERDRPDLVVRQVSAVTLCWFQSLRTDEAEHWLAQTVERADTDLDVDARIAWRGARMLFAMERIDVTALVRWTSEMLAMRADRPSVWQGIAVALTPSFAAFVNPDNVTENLLAVDRAHRHPATARAPWLRSIIDHSHAHVLLAGGLYEDAIEPYLRCRADPDADPYWRLLTGGILVACQHLAAQHAAAITLAEELLTEYPDHLGRYADLAIPMTASVAFAGAGDLDRSRSLLRTQLDTIQRRHAHSPTAAGIPIINAAVLLTLEHRPDTATTVLAATTRNAMHTRWEGAFGLHRAYTKQLHAELGDPAFLASIAEAETLTPDELIAIAREVSNR